MIQLYRYGRGVIVVVSDRFVGVVVVVDVGSRHGWREGVEGGIVVAVDVGSRHGWREGVEGGIVVAVGVVVSAV